MNMKERLYQIGKKAKEASLELALMEAKEKNKILRAMAKALLTNKQLILKANKADIAHAKRRVKSKAIIDRLSLSESRIRAMSSTMQEVAALEDHIGRVEEFVRRPNGLLIGKMRVPIGVIGIIYEARPNVTSDCIALCLKSGNCVILRGGSESVKSNLAIFNVLKKAAEREGLPEGAINFIDKTDRKVVDILLRMHEFIDLIIPRGGESLIKEVARKARIPVIKHYKGVCHVYVDEYADLNMAERIVVNAKVQRPGVCNAIETLLVHKDMAARYLPSVVKKLRQSGVEIRGCAETRKIIRDARRAKESDWYEEYLDLILAVKVVNSVEDAISHIRKYGSTHSDAIVTENYEYGMKFIREVDSACVYINSSTRFTDGNQFGKGAEIGISTDKIHARGPMGVCELTSYKYVIFGNGQIRK
ncbi:MAG: glutamate-5-semialdehyde dehydrogenase [Candidatus Omnitrophica bacterium]|nr:glutamate-5-semialdehyde dehydrogenase [Candidatus Omnitrophota bacterium]